MNFRLGDIVDMTVAVSGGGLSVPVRKVPVKQFVVVKATSKGYFMCRIGNAVPFVHFVKMEDLPRFRACRNLAKMMENIVEHKQSE